MPYITLWARRSRLVHPHTRNIISAVIVFKNNKSYRLTRGRGIGQWAEALIDTEKEKILVIMDMVGKCFLATGRERPLQINLLIKNYCKLSFTARSVGFFMHGARIGIPFYGANFVLNSSNTTSRCPFLSIGWYPAVENLDLISIPEHPSEFTLRLDLCSSCHGRRRLLLPLLSVHITGISMSSIPRPC